MIKTENKEINGCLYVRLRHLDNGFDSEVFENNDFTNYEWTSDTFIVEKDEYPIAIFSQKDIIFVRFYEGDHL